MYKERIMRVFFKLNRKLAFRLEILKDYANSGLFEVNTVFLIKMFLDSKFRNWAYRTYERTLRDTIFEKYGVKFADGTSAGSLREIYFEKIYSQFSDFEPERNGVVIDVGAHHGDFTFYCAVVKHCSKVYSIEPIKGNYELILRNILENRCEDKVVAIHGAASDHNGKINIEINGDMAIATSKISEMLVNCYRIDSLINDSVDILKIDTEGFELQVLVGAEQTIKKHQPRIILETHSKVLKESCDAFLQSLGYELAHEGSIVQAHIPSMDNVQNLFFKPQPNVK